MTMAARSPYDPLSAGVQSRLEMRASPAATPPPRVRVDGARVTRGRGARVWPWLLLAVLLFACPMIAVAAPDPAGAPGSATVAGEQDSLAATWQEPWNPPHALARRRAWEQVVLLPGRLVSLPLSGLGYVTSQSLEFLEQSGRAPIGPTTPGSRSRWPIAPRLAHLGDRTGLGAGVAAQFVLPDPIHSRLGVEYAASNKFYNRTVASWSGKPLLLQYGYEWRPQDRFYGVGTSSSRDSVSDYAVQGEFVRGGARWAWGHEAVTARPRLVVSAWAGPRSEVTRKGREHGTPSYDQRFPAFAAPTLDGRVEHFVYGANGLADHRTGAPHWSRGWRLLASAERFGTPVRALALHSASGDGAAFTRFQLEAETGVSFMRDPRTLRFAVHVTDQQVTAHRDRFLPSDMATLGGLAGLAGFLPGRFHDAIDIRSPVNFVSDITLRLKTAENRAYGRVLQWVFRGQSLANLLGIRGPLRPEYLHHLVFKLTEGLARRLESVIHCNVTTCSR